ncbi:MAG: DEAD/DEAH box helicase family protein [Synergistaceae bacterium]|nr:DEAD/DEAH box helicase family protein [Synergistaceae bacterium]
MPGNERRMKFNFKIQPFQTEAVDSVAGVFEGQSKQDGEAETGCRNAAMELPDERLLENIRRIQTRNNIKLSPSLVKELGAASLDVEMETGTGKTYVYIKTMFDLYKRYGWGKFIVVVPSVAIREGVKKSFEITREHFMELYGVKARFFVYNSADLRQLDEFSGSFGLNVMIINIQAFATSLKEDGRSKEARIIYSKRDEFGSRRPIDVIKANRPIIILDEPQKMEGAATQNALKNNFSPLFSLNYSATHRTQHNLVYVLDALDAFQKRLVKKIEVKGFEFKNLRGTDKYLYLLAIVLDPKKPPRAKLELEVKHQNGIKREVRVLGVGDSLYAASNNLEQYGGMSISEVDPTGRGVVTFSNGGALSAGEGCGDVSETEVRRIQIRETILSHFEKEEKLFQSGIKCLSLFFIDEVAKYRQYDDDGRERLGEYGKIFEREYVNALNELPALFPSGYREYLRRVEVADTHRGYFSIDRQGRAVDSAVKRGGEFSDDISAYELILKNKERLLSFDEPTRFIFSHSALREGWDNPNVFQICTLKHSDNATAKRQEVGRGLRLCVNQKGDRQDAEVWDEQIHDVNKLTVIASESYAGFVTDLQSKIREDLYDRPTKATVEYFTGKTVMSGDHPVELNERQAKMIYQYLSKNDYIDYDDNVTPTYRESVEQGVFAALPEELAPLSNGIHTLIQAIFDPDVLKDMIENGHDAKIKDNPLNENFYRQEFQELWKEINRKYNYTVEFGNPELIAKSIAEINANLRVSELKYTLTEGSQTGTEFDVFRTRTRTFKHAQDGSVRYDLIGKIADGATLARRSAAKILTGLEPDKLRLFRLNPEEFINKVVDEINRQKAAVIVEHTYHDADSRRIKT